MTGNDKKQKAEAVRLLDRIERAAAEIIAAAAKLRKVLLK